MRFGRWYPLDVASEHAPSGPGVYQVKVAHGLIDYPTGKSAMILYGASDQVAQAVAELAAGHPGRPWMCRFAEDLGPRSPVDPDGIVRELVTVFRRRFGAPPRFPP